MGKVATSPLPSRGSPPLRSRGQNQKWPTSGPGDYVTPAVSGIPTAAERGGKSEMAHLWAKWPRHPCRLGDPHRCRAGGKIRSGPEVGKVATSPLPSRGSPPLQSGGQNQKWPTYGQSGYVTPAVSGIPTAAERGAKSEMAHLWAKWLRHPCRLGDPHRCRAGGKIRSGPQMGKVATSPLPSRGSPPLQSGGQNQKWPTSGKSGYVTPAVSGIPTASQRRGKSEGGKVATSPLPSRGSPPLQSGGQNQKWPGGGQSGYVTPAVSGIPTAAERGAKSEVAHLWAKWLRHPCRLGDPHRCRAGGKIRNGPLMGKVATSPLPSRGSPPLQSGGQNQKWPTNGQSGYVTPAVSGIPTAAERGAKSEVAHKWEKWLRHPCRLGDPHRFTAEGKIRRGQSGYVTPAVSGIPTAAKRGAKSEVAHLWAKWLRHPCRLGDPHRFRAGGGNQKWPTCGQSGYVTPAVSGIPTAAERGGKYEVAHKWAKWLRHPCRLGEQSGGQNQKWPTSGQSGYVTPAVAGIPTAAERGAKSEMAHKWARWLPHPCRLGDPHRFRAGGEIGSGQSGYVTPAVSGSTAGGKIRSGPLMGKVSTSPLPSRGSPPLQSGGEIRSGPLVGKVATSPLPSRGSPPLQGGGENQKWAKWLRHPCCLGEQSGGENQKWPTYGQSVNVTPAVSGIPTASERGENQKWPTCGQSGYATPAVSGIPTAAERGAKSEVAHIWARWLRHPCRLGDPHLFRAGGKIRSGPLMGKVSTSRLPSRGSPPLRSGGLKSEVAHLWAKWLCHPCRLGEQSGGENQKWPTYGQSVNVTPAVSGIPTASERGAKIRSGPLVGKVAMSPLPSRGSPPLQDGGGGGSEMAHKWAKWLRHPCRLRDPHRCRAGGKSEVAHLWAKWLRHPCRLGDPHQYKAGGRNQKWPTSGQSGYVTPAVSGIPTAAERGAKSDMAHLWAKWLRHPCRLGDPHRCRAGGKIRSGPQVGKVATSPLPSRGSPPLQSGGGNQKWAKWLRHHCRLGDPHRCRAGGKIRSGPQVGKVATSPLPSWGSPPVQSGGQNQKWPGGGQSGYVTPAVSGSRAGGEIKSGPLMGKVATPPLPSRGSPPLQSGGGNQKWPRSGQSGYVTPAVSGFPTAAERGGKYEVAHKWAK